MVSTSRALDKRKRDLAGYLSQKGDAEKKLAELINYASCSDLDALMEIESKSELSCSIKDKLETAREQLLKNGDGLSIEEIAEEVSRFERDKLAGEIDEAEQNINANNDKVVQVNKEIWSIGQEMKEINTTDAANDAAELAQGALASLQNGVESYVQHRLAAAILRMQIDEYRRESQGPLLAKANKIFPRLTLGSFKSLTVDYDADDKPVLLGVRPSGKTVSIDGMSEGALINSICLCDWPALIIILKKAGTRCLLLWMTSLLILTMTGQRRP